jgi:prevent-host-death family protein
LQEISILSILDIGEVLMKITSTEFQQNVGRYQDAAQRAPVAITKGGRPHTVLMSAAFFDMILKGRVVRRVEDLDEETLKAIADAAVSPEEAALDDLIKDWAP